ncbi:MAG: hypothetical protein EOO04_34655, partial [Chitinophagaceae bacterium]
MNKTIQLSFIITTILTSAFAYAQPSYREGFVVDNSGDTSKGWIDYRQWERNPKTISFKKDLSLTTSTQFTIDDLTYFSINGSDRYTRAIVKKDIRPVDLHLVSESDVDSTVTDTVFLRILVDAHISLYELVDSKPHYYIKEPGQAYTELIYQVRARPGGVQKLPLFQNQLRTLLINAGNPGELQSLLSRTDYKESDLVKATESINKLLYGGDVFYKTERLKQPVSLFVGTGMVYSKLKFSGDQSFGANLQYTSSFQPLFTGGVDFYFGRNHQRLRLRVDLTLYSLQYEGTNHATIKDTITYKIKANNLTPAVSILYNVLNNPAGALYIGAGYAFNISSYPENDFSRKYTITGHTQKISPYVNLEKGWASITG